MSLREAKAKLKRGETLTADEIIALVDAGYPVVYADRMDSDKRPVGRPKHNVCRLKVGMSAEQRELLELYAEAHGCGSLSEAVQRLIDEHAARSLRALGYEL